jgi:hypothetical protein
MNPLEVPTLGLTRKVGRDLEKMLHRVLKKILMQLQVANRGMHDAFEAR